MEFYFSLNKHIGTSQKYRQKEGFEKFAVLVNDVERT